jgi:RNA polymerase sigma factor (sigma-70 family)
VKTEDSLLIDAIRSGNARSRDWALYRIYSNSKYKEFTRTYITSHHGLEADVDDVFQEAIILLDRNLRNGAYKEESTLGTYLMAIVKWTWLGIQRKKKLQVVEIDTNSMQLEVGSAESSLLSEEREEIMNLAINQLGSKCRELLGQYKLDHTMKEIAMQLGYSSAEMAKKQAYRCREKLKIFFTCHTEYREIFFNN